MNKSEWMIIKLIVPFSFLWVLVFIETGCSPTVMSPETPQMAPPVLTTETESVTPTQIVATTTFLPAPTLVLSPTPIPSVTQTPSRPKKLERINQIGGINMGIMSQSGYAYLGVGPRMVIFDASNPNQLIPIGQTGIFRGVVQGLTISDYIAYIVTSEGMFTVDVSTPTAPKMMGSISEEIWGLGRIIISQNTAYVIGDMGLLIFDVSDPASPERMGSLPEYTTDAGIEDSLAYVTSNITTDFGLRVLDVSDPHNPVEIGSLSMRAGNLVIDGDIAYMEGDNQFHLIDISDPTIPTLISSLSFDDQSYVSNIVVVGDIAYLFERGKYIRMINVSDPANPYQINRYELPRWAESMEVAQNSTGGVYAYLGWGVLGVIDVSDPMAPVQLGTYDLWSRAYDIVLSPEPDYAYLTCGIGLCILDISDPVNPTLIDVYDDVSGGFNLAVVENTLYVNGPERWHIYDITQPTAPREIKSFPYSGTGNIEVVDRTVYMPGGWNGLYILDVSDPLNPQQQGIYELKDVYISDVAVTDNTVYAAASDGLHIVDVSNPAQPTEIGYTSETSGLGDVLSVGNILYMTGSESLVHIIDVSDPANPNESRILDLSDWGPNPLVIEDKAYVYSLGSLFMVDVFDPLNPQVSVGHNLYLRRMKDIQYTSPVAVVDNVVYVAAAEGGLFIFSMEESN